MVGGMTEGPDAEIYDYNTDTWSATSPMVQRRAVPAFSLTLLSDNRVLVAGTQGGTNCEIYDPSTDTWAAVAPMHLTHPQHQAALLSDGRVLVVDYATAFSEIHDPRTDQWSFAARPLYTHAWMTIGRLADGRMLVAGTECCATGRVAEIYDPDNDSWTLTPNMMVSRTGPKSVVLDEGSVLVTGGRSDQVCGPDGCDPVETATAELFIP